MDLYGSNPFRILGVRSDASEKDTARAAGRLLKWIEIGEAPQAHDALCYLGAFRRTREQASPGRAMRRSRVDLACDVFGLRSSRLRFRGLGGSHLQNDFPAHA